MTKLMLGVVDVAYSDGDGATTTGDVAGYLEDEYHVMRTFLEMYEDKIGEFLADAMVGEIESLAQGKPVTIFGKDVDTHLGDRVISGQSVNGKIEEAFRNYLDAREWKQVSGQTIEAAEQGVSLRKKQTTPKKPKARAEFFSTGLYSASFRAWTES
jgi:hypothetical protein